MSMPAVTVEVPSEENSTHAITLGLREFNQRHIDVAPAEHFNVVLRDEDGTIVGGCACNTRWTWLYVDMLWVDERVRGRGFGTSLLQAAEAEATRRGCTKAYLDTISFQAKPFYESLGWTVFASQDDYPPGHTRFFLQKSLTPTS